MSTLKFRDLATVSAPVGHRNFSGWPAAERVRGGTGTPTRRGPAGSLRPRARALSANTVLMTGEELARVRPSDLPGTLRPRTVGRHLGCWRQ